MTVAVFMPRAGRWPGNVATAARRQSGTMTVCAVPSVTPHPHAARKLPLGSNTSTRALPLSATYTAPFDCWIAIPTGVWNWPAPEPVLPNELTCSRNDTSVWNVVSAPVVVPSALVATARLFDERLEAADAVHDLGERQVVEARGQDARLDDGVLGPAESRKGPAMPGADDARPHPGARRALPRRRDVRHRDLAPVTPHLPRRITGVHRTWLDPGGFDPIRLGKAPIETPRRAMGDLLGNAVRFGVADDTLAAGEGIETMLSLRCALPTLPMAAALSANHLAALLLALTLRRLYIVRDADPAGDYALTALTERAEAAGIEALALSPRLGDFNENLRTYGIDALRTALRIQLAPQDVVRFMLRAIAVTG